METSKNIARKEGQKLFKNTVRKDEHASNQPFLLFWKCLYLINLNIFFILMPYLPLSDSSKLKEFAEDNFKFDELGRKSFKWEENTEGKGEIDIYEQSLFFQQCFENTCTADT